MNRIMKKEELNTEEKDFYFLKSSNEQKFNWILECKAHKNILYILCADN